MHRKQLLYGGNMPLLDRVKFFFVFLIRGCGNAATLEAVVNHYVHLLGLHLTTQQQADLVEYLKTL